MLLSFLVHHRFMKSVVCFVMTVFLSCLWYVVLCNACSFVICCETGMQSKVFHLIVFSVFFVSSPHVLFTQAIDKSFLVDSVIW